MDEAVPFVDLLIAVGVIIMVLGFLGCCGAIKENRCMLILVRGNAHSLTIANPHIYI
jgi:hypothetical protein